MGTPSIKNFNTPRPRWAAAVSKLLRVVTIGVGSICYATDSPVGMLITMLGGAVADFILDLFPNEQQEQNQI